jgi:DNA topoisomerase-1
VAEAVRDVAEQLGNTPAVCRASYIHPAVVDAYLEGSLGQRLMSAVESTRGAPEPPDRDEELAVLRLLREQHRRERRSRSTRAKAA